MAARAVRKWFKIRNRKKLRRTLIKALAVMDSQSSRTVFMRALTSEFLVSMPVCGRGCGWAWRPFLKCKLWRRRTCAGPLQGPPLEHGHTHIVRQKIKEGRREEDVTRLRFCGLWLFQSCSTSKRAELQQYRRSQFRKKERLRAVKRLQTSAGDVDRSATSRFFRPCTKCCGDGSGSSVATFPNPHFVERDPNFPDVLRPNVSNVLLRSSAMLSDDHTLLSDTNRMHRSIVHKGDWAKPMKTHYVLPTKMKKKPTSASMMQDRRELGTPAVYRRSKLRYAKHRPVDLWGRRNRSMLIDALVGDLRIRAGIPT
jgi:hypothetical protein